MDQTPGSRSPSWPPRPLNPSYDADVRLWRKGGEHYNLCASDLLSVHSQSIICTSANAPYWKEFRIKDFYQCMYLKCWVKLAVLWIIDGIGFCFFFLCFWSWLPQQYVQNVWVGLKAAVSWIMDGIWSQSKHSPLCPLHTAPPMETHFRKRRQRKQGNGDKFILSSNRISDWL